MILQIRTRYSRGHWSAWRICSEKFALERLPAHSHVQVRLLTVYGTATTGLGLTRIADEWRRTNGRRP